MTINELKRRKEELGYSYEIIAALSGVRLEVVEEVFLGNITTTITYGERLAIETLLKEPEVGEVNETSASYLAKKQGEFTIEDYYALPEDVRMELIDGVFYVLNTPSVAHQTISAEITYVLRDYIGKNKGKCKVLAAPLAVQLDCDDKTIVEPDVLVICDRSKIKEKCIYGAPDFVVEILSPSTRKKDMSIKLSKYMNAGVKEYWIVDIEKRRILVYNWGQDDIPSIYNFAIKVPVGIFGDKCEVDFTKIYQEISFLYE